VLRKPEERKRAERMGIADPDRKLTIKDMAAGDVMFSATGVTDGSMLPGVRFGREWIETHTVVMRSATGTVRWIKNRRKAR
jgi:fructose-1,6-bisphosphatase II / sedoheptulose-1,7-bisphosphatase